MFGLLSRIKAYLIVALSVALPIVYLVGQLVGKKTGKNEAEIDRLRDANKTNKEIADFYRKMAEYEDENENGSLHRRDNLIERLRDKGL